MDDDDNDFSFPTGLCGNFRLRPDDDDNDGAASVLDVVLEVSRRSQTKEKEEKSSWHYRNYSIFGFP